MRLHPPGARVGRALTTEECGTGIGSTWPITTDLRFIQQYHQRSGFRSGLSGARDMKSRGDARMKKIVAAVESFLSASATWKW